MECLDVNNNPIKERFYVETFYKGKDEWRNRIVYLDYEGDLGFFSVMNRANIVKLNTNYSQWLRPFGQELKSIKIKE